MNIHGASGIAWDYEESIGVYHVYANGGSLDGVLDSFYLRLPQTPQNDAGVEAVVDALRRIALDGEPMTDDEFDEQERENEALFAKIEREWKPGVVKEIDATVPIKIYATEVTPEWIEACRILFGERK